MKQLIIQLKVIFDFLIMDYVKVICFLLTFLKQWHFLKANCYFPQEYQGEFVMQSTATVGNGIQYATVNITPASIPIWGNCHRRIGNNFILMLNYTETSCIRCLYLKLRSTNVLQVFTLNQDIISKCYLTEELAEKNCPTDESVAVRKAAEILLFKTKDSAGLETVKEYCPIDGKFMIKYMNNDSGRLNDCTGSHSSMDSCPSGSTLNFRLKDCNFENNDLKFECLASWRGPASEIFLIFIDNRHLTNQKPKYRCGLYDHDYKTGQIRMALSKDSTCSTELVNSSYGFENFILTPKTEKPWPAEATFGICTFPKWMYGNWEHVRVDSDTMIYKDHSSFKTYTIKCVGVQENEDKYLVFSRTQCDEERYNCMRILKRSNNIFEFQLGSRSSSNKDVFTLCSDDNFRDDAWITQGRLDLLEKTGISTTGGGTCPISGEYIGIIPDGIELDLCAKLWSDCKTSDLMYYQVYGCTNKEIYEEREYKCLGHWRESKFLYTYTQRRDVAEGTYECFVGVKMSNKKIHIKEAGEHCQRHIDPLSHGMQLNQTSNYTTPRGLTSSTLMNFPTDFRESSVTLPPTKKSTTTAWSFDNEGVEINQNSSAYLGNNLPYYLISSIFICIIQVFM